MAKKRRKLQLSKASASAGPVANADAPTAVAPCVPVKIEQVALSKCIIAAFNRGAKLQEPGAAASKQLVAAAARAPVMVPPPVRAGFSPSVVTPSGVAPGPPDPVHAGSSESSSCLPPRVVTPPPRVVPPRVLPPQPQSSAAVQHASERSDALVTLESTQTKDDEPCGTQSQVVAASGTGRPIEQSVESIVVSTSQKNSFDYKIRTRKFPKEVLEKWDAINKRGVSDKNAKKHRLLQEVLACAGGGFDSAYFKSSTVVSSIDEQERTAEWIPWTVYHTSEGMAVALEAVRSKRVDSR